MKYALPILLAATIIISGTAVYQPAGSLDYYLILKPYPSASQKYGGGEDKYYQQLIEAGKIPEWLTDGKYIKISWGSMESSIRWWEYLWIILKLLVFVGWPVYITILFGRLAWRLHLTKTGT